jgi:DNA-binding NarL/FixJ family response regulator
MPLSEDRSDDEGGVGSLVATGRAPAGGVGSADAQAPDASAVDEGAVDERTVHSVMVVDDDPPLRGLMRRLLEADGGFDVTGEAGDGFVALDVIAETTPDIVLLDLMMPGLDGRAALPRLVHRSPRSMIVVVTTLSAETEADQTFAAGAFAYLEKSLLGPGFAHEVRELRQLFDRALAGETVWVPNGPRRVRR